MRQKPRPCCPSCGSVATATLIEGRRFCMRCNFRDREIQFLRAEQCDTEWDGRPRSGGRGLAIAHHDDVDLS
jgi:hypothetical protein